LVAPSLDIGLFDCIKTLKNDLSILHPIKIAFQVEGIKEEDLEEKFQLYELKVELPFDKTYRLEKVLKAS